LRSGRHRYFARKLPSREQWHAFDAFRRHVVYLDIETTGFSIGRHAVTVVGVYDGRRKRSFVQGDNLEDLPGALRQAKMLVTFNLEDAVNLEPLAEFAYEALRSLCLDRGYVTADRYESDGHSVVRLRPSRHEDRAQAS